MDDPVFNRMLPAALMILFAIAFAPQFKSIFEFIIAYIR